MGTDTNTTSGLGHNPDATAAELLRAREGFDPKAHIAATQDAPRVTPTPFNAAFTADQHFGPNSAAMPPRRADSTTRPPTGMDGSIKVDEIFLLAHMEEVRAIFRNNGLHVVAVGDKPVDDGYALNQQARIAELETANANLLSRAIVAEKTAADTIRDIESSKTSFSGLEAENSTLRSRADAAEKTAADLRSELESLKASIATQTPAPEAQSSVS